MGSNPPESLRAAITQPPPQRAPRRLLLALASRAPRRTAVGALLAAALAAIASLTAAATRAPVGIAHLTLYSLSTDSQFINHQDDRARGEGNNPFGNYSSFVSPPINERFFGPSPTDVADFAFALFTDPKHTREAGAAAFICQYNFDQNAFCDASFQLSGGTLIGAGAFNFNATRFTLAVTGGTYRYRGMKGELEVTAGGVATQKQPVLRAAPMLQAQRLAFVIRLA